ncbi:hypothetical protein J3459_017385 [Metarhizium acridum]|uniref:uncharacterized protein n=1 Tax=Metarhizium acridum TaxID=92637 RepID=UPI001C6BEDD8|nr:hypothetical protein J3459_017385 [Metarhizium acridum]KAG8413378.1 hypothetical protein J3458_012947 [Metarhizium acridum]
MLPTLFYIPIRDTQARLSPGSKRVICCMALGTCNEEKYKRAMTSSASWCVSLDIRQVAPLQVTLHPSLLSEAFSFSLFIPRVLTYLIDTGNMHFSKALLASLACSFAAGAPVSDVGYTAIEKRDFNLNAFLAAIVEIFPVNVPVNGICTALGIGETALAAAFGLKVNANRRGCADVTVVFARGTCDPGNVGTLVGPPFFGALEAAIGSSKSVAIQGVEYPATVDGYLRADPAAGVTM